MVKTIKQMAVHSIRLGDGSVVVPGKPFECPVDDKDWLQDAGACVDIESEQTEEDEKAAEAAEEADKAKAEHQALLKRAKELGISNARANMKAETLQKLIDSVEASSEDDEDIV